MNKKSLLVYSLMLLGTLGVPNQSVAQSQVASTSNVIYDFSKYDAKEMLKLFASVAEQGHKYPSVEQLKNAGLYDELEFVRSHVKKRTLLSFDDRLNKNTYAQRELFLNLPSGVGKQTGGFPSKDFAHDNFSMWNYTHLWGSWNHSLFQAPGSWVDAAHKNGSDIMSGIIFFDNNTASNAWMSFIREKNSDGNYKYVKPLIHLLEFLGMDGINYNWEASGYTSNEVKEFHQALYQYAHQEKFNNFHIVIYTQSSSLSSWESGSLFGEDGKRTAEVMLNYVGNGFNPRLTSSVNEAEAALKTTSGLYAGGWIVGMDKNWSSLSADNKTKKCGIALWGEHDQSRFWSYNSGGDPQERMSNYQMLLERAFSGGNRNPANLPAVKDNGNSLRWSGKTPPLNTFAGIATWIPERSAISGNLPFATNFCIGNGYRYHYKGKKTFDSWYNMSAQDIVPTYRWLVYQGESETPSSAIQPEFTHKDAYIGGSCLQLTGKETANSTDIILYKTHLQGTSGSIKANIALKTGKDVSTPSHLWLLLHIANTNTWKEYEVGALENAHWAEKELALTDLSSADVIDKVGFRVKNVDENYKILIGKLELKDDFTSVPAEVKNLSVSVREETKASLSVKATWLVDHEVPASGLLYNDDANIDHFEVFYKNGETGRVSEVGRTSQWAYFLGDIKVENVSDVPYIGVRSVSKDLKTTSPIVWTPVTRAEQDALPAVKDNSYGTVELDFTAAGYQTAQKYRYVEKIETEGALENITYVASGATGGKNYVDATDKVMKVKQGQTVTIKVKGHEATKYAEGTNDDLRYCLGKAWLDLDGDHQFHPDLLAENPTKGECLFTLGKYKQAETYNVQALYPFTFTVPEDAHVGKSRLRIVYSDAWFEGALQPVGKFNKGFAIDLGVEIVGEHASRKSANSTWDEGIADEPDMSHTTTAIEAVEQNVGKVLVQGNKINFEGAKHAYIYTQDGALVVSLSRPTVYSIASLPAGTYIIKVENNKGSFTQKIVK